LVQEEELGRGQEWTHDVRLTRWEGEEGGWGDGSDIMSGRQRPKREERDMRGAGLRGKRKKGRGVKAGGGCVVVSIENECRDVTMGGHFF